MTLRHRLLTRRTSPLILLVLVLLLIQQTPAPAQAPGGRLARLQAALPAVDAVFQDFARRSRAPGIVYGVLIDGRLVHTGAVGVRDRATNAPVDTRTVFRIASMTKSVTALAILRLRDEGTLALDDPAERYVPELATLAYPTTDSPRITIRHLLSHSEGFPEDNPWGDQQLAIAEDEFTALLRSGIPFSNAPGVAYEYSNYGFAILGRIVARVSGMPYGDYVRTHLFEPLGMSSSTFEPRSVPSDRLALGYRWEDETWKEEPQLADGAFGPMGGMLTSLDDLARYVGFLMDAWPARSEPDSGPVSRASVREMQQTARTRPATASGGGPSPLQLLAQGYGYGLRIRQTCDYRHIVSHSGGLPGFGSQMRWHPEEGIGFIAMGNLTYTGWDAVFDRATAVLADTGALTRRQPEPSAALLAARTDVMQLINAWDDDLADRVAAMNLFLDESKDRRRQHITRLRDQVGQCHAATGLDAENALRGQWTMACERGFLRVAITLSPTIPPKVQHLSVQPAPADPPARVCGG